MKLIPHSKSIDTDDNIGRGMDFALVILVFLGIGWALDRAFDTRPAFMVGCVVFSVVGQFVRMWYQYDATMHQQEAARLAERHAAPRAAVALDDLSHDPISIPRGFGSDDAASTESSADAAHIAETTHEVDATDSGVSA